MVTQVRSIRPMRSCIRAAPRWMTTLAAGLTSSRKSRESCTSRCRSVVVDPYTRHSASTVSGVGTNRPFSNRLMLAWV